MIIHNNCSAHVIFCSQVPEQCLNKKKHVKNIFLVVLNGRFNSIFVLPCLIFCYYYLSHRIEIDLHFEKAYSLYRLNKTREALDILNAIAEPTEHEKELKAQVVRRLIHLS